MERVLRGLCLLLILPACTNGTISSWDMSSSSTSLELVPQPNFSRALYFDGINDYADLSHVGGLDPDAIGTQYTIEAWIKPTGGAGTSRAIWAFENFVLQLNTSDKFEVWYHMGTCGTYSSGASYIPTTIINNNTYHVAYVRQSSGAAYVCVQGNCAGLQAISQIFCPNTTTRIGAKIAGGSHFPGYIDEIRVSNNQRYAASSGYSVPTGPYAIDGSTVFLFHLNYLSGINNGQIYHPISHSFNLFNGSYFTSSPF